MDLISTTDIFVENMIRNAIIHNGIKELASTYFQVTIFKLFLANKNKFWWQKKKSNFKSSVD